MTCRGPATASHAPRHCASGGHDARQHDDAETATEQPTVVTSVRAASHEEPSFELADELGGRLRPRVAQDAFHVMHRDSPRVHTHEGADIRHRGDHRTGTSTHGATASTRRRRLLDDLDGRAVVNEGADGPDTCRAVADCRSGRGRAAAGSRHLGGRWSFRSI
jgi:hypothetical protein